jgi:hypothetical protein
MAHAERTALEAPCKAKSAPPDYGKYPFPVGNATVSERKIIRAFCLD